MIAERNLKSDYMHFAKFRAQARCDLATSGVKATLPRGSRA